MKKEYFDIADISGLESEEEFMEYKHLLGSPRGYRQPVKKFRRDTEETKRAGNQEKMK